MLDGSTFDTIGGAIYNGSRSAALNPDEYLHEVTICLRFRLKYLGGYKMRKRGHLLSIGEWYVNKRAMALKTMLEIGLSGQSLNMFGFCDQLP